MKNSKIKINSRWGHLISVPNRVKCNEHIFDVINTPAKAYWLGYLYCDGSIDLHNGYYVGLWSIDLDQLQKFKRFLRGNQKIRFHKNKRIKNGAYSITVGSRHLVQTLMSCGIIPRKTYDHSISIYIPRGSLERHFWRGCIDADGHISIFRRSGTKKELIQTAFGLSNNNMKLLDLCQKYFGKGSVGYCSKASVGQFTINGRIPKTLLSYISQIYIHAPKHARLERKYRKYLEVKKLAKA